MVLTLLNQCKDMKKIYWQAGDQLTKLLSCKILKHMRNTLLLLLITFFQSYATISYSQTTLLSLDLKDATVGSVLEKIEEQSDFYFLFNAKLVDIDRKVSVSVNNQKIFPVLDRLFTNTNVEYVVYNQQIVLSPGEYIAGLKNQAQQPRTITGTVTDQNGDPVIGASVVVKGTTLGTITDVQGNFSLANVPEDGVLVFSFVGMRTQEIPVEGRTVFTLMMEEDIIGMEEIVVVGYGTQKKENLTGSVDVVSAEKLVNRSAPNMSFLLQGVSPNLDFTIDSWSGGEPGSSGTFNIRGIGSISGNDSPLILVDGVEMNINNVNPESIESISILKDASASAIYGSRAPFGVVLITTKRGAKSMSPIIKYSNNLAAKHPMNIPHLEDALTWAEAYNQANANAGSNPTYSEEQIERIKGYMAGTFPYEYDPDNPISGLWNGRRYGNANYDWPHEYFKKWTSLQKHDVSLSGGDAKTQYYFSGGFLDEEGIYNFGYDLYQRYNVMANITSQVTDWLSFDFNTKYAMTKTDYPEGQTVAPRERIFAGAYTFSPMQPKYNINGSIANPYIRLLEESGRNKTENNDLWITLGTEVEPIKGWKTRVSYNVNKFASRFTANPHPVLVELGTGAFANMGRSYTAFETTFRNNTYAMYNAVTSYEKTLGNHYLKALVGYEQEEKLFAGVTGRGDELITQEVPSISTALGTLTVSDNMSNWSTQGVFGRLNYNFKEKYLLEFSARYNGSSRFAPESRWGFFPSASAGYIISKESFWEPVEPYVNRLKIRGSYGSLGNQNVGNYLYLSRIPVNDQLPWIIDSEMPLYASVPALTSKNLTWETITTTNLGVDAGFLDNRLDFVFDWYVRKTEDMIGPSETLPFVLGASAPKTNNAELETKGFEILLRWRDRVSSDFSYNAQISLGDNKTTILKYTNANGLIDTWYAGKDVGEIWGFISDGLMQTDEDLAEMPDQSYLYSRWSIGDMKYKDLNDDEKIDRGLSTLDDHGDLTVIGNISPRYNIGIAAGFNWKGFDFNMFWQGIGKRDYYPGLSSTIFWGMTYHPNTSGIYKDTDHLNYWRPADETHRFGPNTDAYYPKPYFSKETRKNRQAQSRYLLNAAYLRLKNCQLGYTVPAQISDRLFFQNARIYISGENLLTLKHLPKLIDPEASIAAEPSMGGYESSSVIYPLSTMVSVGINITF